MYFILGYFILTRKWSAPQKTYLCGFHFHKLHLEDRVLFWEYLPKVSFVEMSFFWILRKDNCPIIH